MVAWTKHQVAVDCQDSQGIQQGYLLCNCFVGSTKLVEHSPIQTVVDGVKGETLGTPLRLEWWRRWDKEERGAWMIDDVKMRKEKRGKEQDKDEEGEERV